MVKKRGKEIYQPPYAHDLSGLGAMGQVQPTGMCSNGDYPTIEWCTDGTEPVPGFDNCSPTGSVAEYGGCDTGNTASDPGCEVGSIFGEPT